MSASLLIHQAYFGAVNGVSHGELASSLPDADLRAFLVAFTDRPGVVPHGISLPSYLTATPYGPYYLLSRTWADKAVARPGMVFTHVLLLPLAASESIADLTTLLQQFVSQPPPVKERNGLLLPLTLPLPAAANESLEITQIPSAWLTAAGHLAEQPAETSLIVAGNPVDFEQLLVALWRGLPPALRSAITFGIRFTPPAMQEKLPRLVYVPAELADRWRGRDMLMLEPEARRAPTTILEQFVFGGNDEQAFRQFVAEVGCPIVSFRMLRLHQQSYELTRRVQQKVATSDDLLLLLRGLNLLQPDPTQAVDLKKQAVDSLAVRLNKEDSSRVLALRNLSLLAFQTGQDRLSPVVEQQVYALVLADRTDPDAMPILLDQLAETDSARQQYWWQHVANTAFSRALHPATLAAARAVWLGLIRSPATRAFIQDVVPKTSDWEQHLQLTAPTHLIADIAESVLAFASAHCWWDLSATVLRAAYTPVEALSRQLQAEKALGLRESPRLSQLATQVTDTELLQLALQKSSWQLQQLAGERAGQTPALLAGLDVRKPAWLVIWSAAVRHIQSLEPGISVPAATITALLNEIASDLATGPEVVVLLEWIATSVFANVLTLPAREQLWEKLPAGVRPYFLQATLDALITAILTGNWSGTVEPTLRAAAQDKSFTTRLLRRYQSDTAAILDIDAVLGNLRDESLRDYLTLLPNLTSILATRLGTLIATRHWLLSARLLLTRAVSEPTFRPALQECAHLFSWWERIPYRSLFSHLSVRQDGWQALEELMKQLYERGPDESGIWRRAGGDPAELPSAATRAAQWGAAVLLLRNGGGGAISVKSLLQAAKAQFPANERLRVLSEATHLFTSR